MQLIASMGPALGFDQADTAVLIQLCQHHLLLPETATRRDLDDPATVAAVVHALDNSDVDRPELLNLVAALTEADAKATGPAAWSQWRADLINELVQRTQQALRGEAHESDPTLTSEQLDLLERGWGSAGINVEVAKHKSAWRVTVVAQDRPGLMADVAGVLSMNRLAVRAATLRTDRHRALQVWTVQPTFGDAPGAERLRADLVGVFDERIDLQARLAQREAAYAKPTVVVASARIEVVDASQRANVIEVRSHDGPALLHRIGLAFAQSGVAVQSAQVSTMGSEAVDVFYITDAQGNKLDQSSVDRVVQSLEAALVPAN
jgi:[protein-PII] uridylyltransferase